MSTYFEKYAQKGNEFLHLLAIELKKENDIHGTARILRNTLHVLRNHLTVEESMQMISQLPLVIKGIYVDGWKIQKKRIRMKHVDDLVAELMEREGAAMAEHDVRNEAGARHAIRCVFKVLNNYVSDGELRDVAGVMSKELKMFFESVLDEKDKVI